MPLWSPTHPTQGRSALQQPAHASLREGARRNKAPSQLSALASFPAHPPRWGKAEAYGDSKVFGGAADFPGRRDRLGDVLHGDSHGPDLLRQPNDHLALRSLESPALSRGSVRLKPESSHPQWQGTPGAQRTGCFASSTALARSVGWLSAWKGTPVDERDRRGLATLLSEDGNLPYKTSRLTCLSQIPL